ncbi:MAG: NUDIX domain-containing protein [Cyanobacteria bacterium J06649_11]
MSLLNLNDSKANGEDEIDKIAFVDTKNQKVLVSKSKGKSKYYIPGGKREANESDEDTLIREVKEELSVSIQPQTIQYLGTFTAPADGKPKGINVRMTCYEAKYSGRLAPSSEIETIDWFDCTNMDSIAEVDKKIFRSLKKCKRIN